MDSKQFRLGVICAVLAAFVIGPLSYFSYQATVVRARTEIEVERLRLEAIVAKETIEQNKKT